MIENIKYPRTFDRLFDRKSRAGLQSEASVIITFDDGLYGVYKNAYPIMKELGFRGVCFVITGLVGRNIEGHACMNGSMLQELNDAGWEIGSHTSSHMALDVLSESEARDELLGSRSWIERNILNSESVVSMSYPHSKYNRLAQSFYKFCRIGGIMCQKKRALELWNEADFDKIPATSVTNADSSSFIRYLNKLKTKGGLVVIYFHNVSENGTSHDISPNNFQRIMKCIKDYEIKIQTFKELNNKYRPNKA